MTEATKDPADIAADYIEGFLDIADLDGDLEISQSNGRDYVSIVSGESDDLGVLAKPDAVSALQELTRLSVHTATGEFSRLILDVAGSRDARSKELERLVDRAVERIEGGAQSAALPRCPPTSASSCTTSSRIAASRRTPKARALTATRSSVAHSFT